MARSGDRKENWKGCNQHSKAFCSSVGEQEFTTHTKIAVYRACIVSTLFYESESWTTYAGQEKRLHTFHMRCLRRILSISCRTDKISNNTILDFQGIPTMHTLHRQRRLRWIGHVRRMEDDRMIESLRISCMGSWNLGRWLLADLSYASGCLQVRHACDWSAS